MRAAKLTAYREKLRRERIRRWVLTAVWFIVTLVLAIIYRDLFGIDTLWVTCLCLGIIQSTILDRRKIDAKQFRKLMADDAALRAKWYEEHDERMLMINMRAGIPFVDYMNMALELAALIVLPFSATVCVTLLAMAFTQTLVSTVAKIYWMRKLTGVSTAEEDE